MLRTEVLHADFSSERASQQVARMVDVMQDDILVVQNRTVFAAAVNAANPNVQRRIVEVKDGPGLYDLEINKNENASTRRGLNQLIGWTRPFDQRMVETISKDAINNPLMRELLSDGDELTRYIGGWTFLKAIADRAAKNRYNIPHALIAPKPKGDELDLPTVQMYSTEGIDETDLLIRAAIARGIEPAMTSANVSNTPEATTAQGALEFANATHKHYKNPPLVAVHTADGDIPFAPRGSYPILFAASEGFIVDREGCFDTPLISRLMYPYNVVSAAKEKPNNYPSHQLRLEDLPADWREVRPGPEFRSWLLTEVLKWSSVRPELSPSFR